MSKRKLIDRVIPFVRMGSCSRSNCGIETIAVVRCKVDACQETATHTIEALKEALTSWLNKTKVGKKAWKYSAGDFNIGDLAMYEDSFLKSHGKMLTYFGIHNFEIVCLMNDTETMPFDMVLAHSDEINV